MAIFYSCWEEEEEEEKHSKCMRAASELGGVSELDACTNELDAYAPPNDILLLCRASPFLSTTLQEVNGASVMERERVYPYWVIPIFFCLFELHFIPFE